MVEIPTKAWVERYDVAQLLQKEIDLSSWKGDEHTKGIFFTDEYGYTLNKILAVRIRHSEAAPDVYYAFNAPNEEDSVTLEYPFKGMKVQPKKHYLLFKEQTIEKENIDRLFFLSGVKRKIKVDPLSLIQLISQVDNKREQERSTVILEISPQNETGKIEIVRYRKSKKEKLLNQVFPFTPVDQAEDESVNGCVNTYTLLYLLKLFYSFPYVFIYFGRDRIMITEENEHHTPQIEVVIAHTKIE